MKHVIALAILSVLFLQGCCHTCHPGRADHCAYGMGYADGPQGVPEPVGVAWAGVTGTSIGNVLFAFDSAVLDPEAIAQLDQVFSMAGPQGHYVLLEGHASSEGSQQYNLDLAQRRANSAKAYLVSKGVPDANVTATSRGESEPAVPNDTEANRRLNRRVEIRLQGR